ncbi:hypothetical protein BD410DRAFT_782770 [Rickenella mellea]|uniref:Uncharacterized protein n=1 Tax=Rickenella mellea TaxID=50990 RepID=A0A4Y7QJ06_9AGAM|nr:hypothetical protein BD410DRAFT_782770 [Rickenella mellea]
MPAYEASAQPPRSSMRRKSSAQNLLHGFKANPPGGPSAGLQPTGGTIVMQIPSAAMTSGMSAGGSTPIATTPMSREWDAQSMHSDSVASSSATLVNGSPALPAQGTSVEYLRDLVTKRMITLTYLRNVYEGRSHWFHTIVMSRADLERVFNNTEMKKRTYQFAILGMSLSNLFDIQNAQDLLRGLQTTLAEYDQSKEDGYKPKMRFFRSSKVPKRQAGAINDYAMSYPDASEASYLLTPHMPFPLDYHQTLLSLLDILSEMYHKISKILGPSPFPHNGQHMMGPLGLLSPHPGVSYLFQGQDAAPSADSEGSLWGIANGAVNVAPGYGFTGSGMMSPPPQWVPALGEAVIKVDTKFKKIISTLLKELDTFARNSIKDELASLDPLLRNVNLDGNSREVYEFGGIVLGGL